MSISVIIPTYKRPSSLARALRSVLQQTHPSYEVIVVDNAVDPRVERIVAGFATVGRTLVRYVPERNLGLHHARHAGARAASGEVLVFTDDDATFDAGWLAAYAQRFSEHLEMAAAGGAIQLAWEVPPPRWLLDYIGDAKEFGWLGLRASYDTFRLDARGVFFGGNMAIRRAVLMAVGGFNPDSFGEIWLGDGEVGLNRKLWQRGMLVGYLPDAVVFHHIPPERMTVSYLCRRIANSGREAEYTAFHEGTITAYTLTRRLARIAGAMGKLGMATTGRLARRDSLALLRAHFGLAYHIARARYVTRLFYDEGLRDLVQKTGWFTEPGRSR